MITVTEGPHGFWDAPSSQTVILSRNDNQAINVEYVVTKNSHALPVENVELDVAEMGGATIVIDYNNSILVYPDQPEYGIDFIFNNFTLGYYDSAKVTKITDGQIWINIDLIDDGRGTLVEGGPDLWTDLVQLNFISNNIVTSDVVFWETYSNYWSIYDSDNFTKWEKGTFDNVTTSLKNEDITNNDFNYSLNQNYPNPFNPLTTIQYSVNKESWVKLIVYNAIGQEVKTLVDETKQIGTYRTGFDATNLTSGIYFYKLQAGDPSTGSGQAFVETKKMILMK